jgi:hypothetical protein
MECQPLGTLRRVLATIQVISMKRAIFTLLAIVLLSAAATTAAPVPTSADVITPIRQFIDGFNNGDTKSAFAAYATGDITIVDEFAPHRWLGPHAAQEWAAAYEKHSSATGVTDGIVKYGPPTPLTEEGQMTFVLRTEAGAWKIAGWTWTGVKPHPAK